MECSVILELKCYATQVPLWMLDMIRCFNLTRRSFSKYTNATMKLLTRQQYDPDILKTAVLW